MRRELILPAAMLALSMVAGCASPAAPGISAGEERPAVAAVAVAAPAVPALPAAESLRVTPQLLVKTVKHGMLFTGRGSWYLLAAEVGPDTEVKYLESREGWLHVQAPDGQRGWLVASDATLTDGRNLGGRYKVQPGHWELAAPSGIRVEVTRRAAGIMRVVIAHDGSLEALPELTALGDRSLALLTRAAGPFTGAIAVGDGGVEQVSVSDSGVLIDLEHPALQQVISSTPQRLEIEFRPALERVEKLDDGWRLQVRGEGHPVLRTHGANLLIDIPAAVNQAKLPDGFALEEVHPEEGASPQPITSPTATIPSRMPAGGLRVRLPLPAGPYAMSQPEQGRYELHRLAPGIAGKRIVLDPGHGGEETGAIGESGVAEKEINLAAAMRLKPLLEAAGAEVIMTRTTDRWVISPEVAAAQTSFEERVQTDLAARSALANRVKADLVLSIHSNAGPPDDAGIEVFWAVSNLNAAQSRHMADLAQAELLSALGLVDRGVKQRAFNVIRYSEAPAILVEMGFVTNPDEEALLLSDAGQQRVAEALLRAVTAYFGK